MHINEIRLCRFMFGMLTMLYLAPTFINVFVIYAIANLHDISWGNRPSQSSAVSKEKHEQKEAYEIFRSKVLIFWVLFNTLFAYAIVYVSRGGHNDYLLLVAVFVAAVLWLRLLFALLNRFLSCHKASRLSQHTQAVQTAKKEVRQNAFYFKHWGIEEACARFERDLLLQNASRLPRIVRMLCV